MIEYISGELKDKNPATAVIEVNGVGYKLYIPYSTYEKLPPNGKVSLFTVLAMQGGIQVSGELKLYGFYSIKERHIFQQLCSVTRVGALLALRIISGSSLEEIREAVISDKVDLLSGIKGVGIKTAQRIIMELKDSMQAKRIVAMPTAEGEKSIANEAVLALVSLGYQKGAAEKSVMNVLSKFSSNISVESVVKKALNKI